MKKYILSIISFYILIFTCNDTYSLTGEGNPLKYISSCELDFNNDHKPDIALLVESLSGRQLIILLKSKNGYEAYVVSKDITNMHLSCHFGKEIKETTAGKHKGRIFKTSGTYLKLTQPEGASTAFFWNGKKFIEVWTSD